MKRILKIRDDNKKIHKIDFWCCEVCGVGAGITKYPDDWFSHYDKKLYKHKEGNKVYELCSTCIIYARRSKVFCKKNEIDAPQIFNRVKRRQKTLRRFSVAKNI